MEAKPCLPPSIAQVWPPLWSEIARLNAKHRVTLQLFGSSEENVAILNRAAGAFFQICQESLIADLFISTGRLLDPPMTGGKANLSLPAILKLIDQKSDSGLHSRLQGLLTEANEHFANAKIHRNKRLAHNDLSTLVSGIETALPGVSRKELEQAISTIASFANAIDSHYCGNTTFFADVIQYGDGESLVRVLKDGLEHRQERLRAKYGDVQPRDAI